METRIFDGYTWALKAEQELASQVLDLKRTGVELTIAAVVFTEDQGSMLYTRLKREAAERVGIGYQPHFFSLADKPEKIIATLNHLNQDPNITGIIIQKPWRHTWLLAHPELAALPQEQQGQYFQTWWHTLTSHLQIGKDVDGLHPDTLQALEAGTWSADRLVLPATCQAVVTICELEGLLQAQPQVVILGKSDLLGYPLFHYLHNLRHQVKLWGKKNLTQALESGQRLQEFDLVVSATGQAGLVTGLDLKEGASVIDVGEPKPDIERVSVMGKASFLTPVPGGVGPMTVVCLLQNVVKLYHQARREKSEQ